jgi:heterodisulfide reductase subunit D
MINRDIINTTEGCRYCLMCRHVCPVTRVTYNESTSPHGWALTIASVRRGLLNWNAETADLLYQCADCGLCQSFCATDQPLPQAIVAARAEVVAAGHAPAAVAAVEAALRRQGHPYTAARETIVAPERAETVLFVGAAAWHREHNSLDAARRLLEAAGVNHGLAGVGRSSGYLAYTLGLYDTARDLARATVEEIKRSGCRRLAVLGPEHAHTFRTVYPLLGTPLPEDIEVIELTTLLADLLDDRRMRLRRSDLTLAYHDPCQTPRLLGRWRAPRLLLAAITTQPVREGFWREQRAANCGASGGLPWTQPRLAADMARAALADAAGGSESLVVTDAPGCLAHLRAAAEGLGLKVQGLYELLAEHLEA